MARSGAAAHNAGVTRTSRARINIYGGIIVTARHSIIAAATAARAGEKQHDISMATAKAYRA